MLNVSWQEAEEGPHEENRGKNFNQIFNVM
jgi:hypothetical protein